MYDQVLEIPSALEARVSPDFIDINGHMNIRHYLGHGAISADALCGEVGIDDEYRRTRRLGVFTVELHLRYMHERREGETFSVHPRLLARSDKSVHLLTYPLDRSNERLANTLEILAVHVDMDTRRAAPFPTDAAVRWDRLIDRSSDLAWPAAVCGAMGVRGGRCIRASGAIKAKPHPSEPTENLRIDGVVIALDSSGYAWNRCVQRKAAKRWQAGSLSSDANTALCVPGPRRPTTNQRR
ncbi:thioesterase family protein [Nocardioides sp. AN3]